MSDVTRILNAIEEGDAKAADKLLPMVYEELRRLAAQKMSKELSGQTLQATALVHEAYIRLVGEEAQNWRDSSHFFRAASEAMRRILIDKARRKQRIKHGGHYQRMGLDNAMLEQASNSPRDDIIALDEALEKLSDIDRTRADVVKLRFFAGLSVEQTARILKISPVTTKRYWAYARAWLLRKMG
jgi:RNA polymerase sigma factor (TIGR02999 family)